MSVSVLKIHLFISISNYNLAISVCQKTESVCRYQLPTTFHLCQQPYFVCFSNHILSACVSNRFYLYQQSFLSVSATFVHVSNHILFVSEPHFICLCQNQFCLSVSATASCLFQQPHFFYQHPHCVCVGNHIFFCFSNPALYTCVSDHNLPVSPYFVCISNCICVSATSFHLCEQAHCVCVNNHVWSVCVNNLLLCQQPHFVCVHHICVHQQLYFVCVSNHILSMSTTTFVSATTFCLSELATIVCAWNQVLSVSVTFFFFFFQQLHIVHLCHQP